MRWGDAPAKEIPQYPASKGPLVIDNDKPGGLLLLIVSVLAILAGVLILTGIVAVFGFLLMAAIAL